jgi:hypothetical protein
VFPNDSYDPHNGLDELEFVAVIKNHPKTRQQLCKTYSKGLKEQEEAKALMPDLKKYCPERDLSTNRWKCVSQYKHPPSGAETKLI